MENYKGYILILIFGIPLCYLGVRFFLNKDKNAKIAGVILFIWALTLFKVVANFGNIKLENKIIVTEYHTGLGIKEAKIKQAASAKKRLQRDSK